jgi:hypothetical protein
MEGCFSDGRPRRFTVSQGFGAASDQPRWRVIASLSMKRTSYALIEVKTCKKADEATSAFIVYKGKFLNWRVVLALFLAQLDL